MKTHLIAGTCEIADVNGFLHALNDIAAEYDITVQAIDASKTAGNEHILAAAEKAIRAVQHRDSISDDLGMEILLYASGNRQIKRALSMGVRTGENEIVLVAVGDGIPDGAIRELENLILVADVTGYTREKRDAVTTFFSITETEIAAVGEEKIPQLVLERVALMGLWK
jgi:KEOPS complex subunit Cgi121